MKTDKYGDSFWTKYYISDHSYLYNRITSFHLENNGYVLVNFGGILKINLQGDLLYSKEYKSIDSFSIWSSCKVIDGYVVSGIYYNGLESHYFIEKLDPFLNSVWKKKLIGTNIKKGVYNMIKMKSGNILLAGVSENGNEIVKLTKDGDILSSYSIDSSNYIRIHQFEEDKLIIGTGDYLYCVDTLNYSEIWKVNVTNRVSNILVEDQSMMVLEGRILKKINNIDGALLWEKELVKDCDCNGDLRYGPSRQNFIQPTMDNGYIITGVYSTPGYGCFPVNHECDENISLIKIDSLGDFVASKDKQVSVKEVALQLYPNPAYSQLTINLPFSISSTTIEIYDIMGRLVISKMTSKQVALLNIASLEPSIYNVIIKTGDKAVRKASFVKL